MTPEKILEIARRYGDHDLADVDWYFYSPDLISFAQSVIEAERERIKSRVKYAAESLWCIRNQVGDEPYGLYIGPSLNTLEQFVEKLMEEE